MIDQIKQDRVTQALIVVTVLVACIGGSVVSLMAYNYFTRQQPDQVSQPPPTEEPAPAQASEPIDQPVRAWPVDLPTPDEPITAGLSEDQQLAYVTIAFLNAAVRLFEQMPNQPEPQNLEETGQRLGQVIGLGAMLQAISEKLDTSPPPGFEPAWEEARAAMPPTKQALSDLLDKNISLSDIPARLAEPRQHVDRAQALADEYLVDRHGVDQAELDRMRAEAMAAMDQALEENQE